MKRENDMSKKRRICFKVGVSGRDAKKPVVAPDGIYLRSPVNVKVRPGDTAAVKLGISLDCQVILLGMARLSDVGLVAGPFRVVDGGQELVAIVTNTTGDEYDIEVGDAIARAVPLPSLDDVELVDG